jgi:RNA polymerase primary sigma factor
LAISHPEILIALKSYFMSFNGNTTHKQAVNKQKADRCRDYLHTLRDGSISESDAEKMMDDIRASYPDRAFWKKIDNSVVSKLPIDGFNNEFKNRWKEATQNLKKTMDMLIQHNIRLAFSAANSITPPHHPKFEKTLDGAMDGLIRTADIWDFRKGKFSTLAQRWIYHTALNGINKGHNTLLTKRSATNAVNSIHREEGKYLAQYGELPSIAELAERLHMSKSRITLLHQVGQLESLDAPSGKDEDGSTLYDLLPSDNKPPLANLERDETAKTVHQVLGTLTAREEVILKMRYGIDGNDEMILDAIGKRFNISRERVRQIEEMALKRLRTGSRRDLLLPVYDGSMPEPS